MAKQRIDVPKSTRDRVLHEFNHRCAICGANNPHVHHIDENPSNNDPLNLLPLCPNCHLVDQHNPTSTIDPDKLKLFRTYKDPTILSPEFEPLFRRLQFLDVASDSSVSYETLTDAAKELVAFVVVLEMGPFYAKRIEDLLKEPQGMLAWTMDTPDHVFQEHSQKMDSEYRETLSCVRTEVYRLSVEMLRYQRWACHNSKPHRSS